MLKRYIFVLFIIMFIPFISCSDNSTSSGADTQTGTVTDPDGNVYKTIKIGNQWWMAENLNYGNMISSIETDEWHSDAQNNDIIEKYCLENNPCNCDTFGGIYDWNEAMRYNLDDSSGICPGGWHIPSDWEWFELLHFLDSTVTDEIEEGYLGNWKEGHVGTNAGNILKENSQNSFNSKLQGYRHASGKFIIRNVEGYWSSTPWLDQYAWMIYIGAYDSTVMHAEEDRILGFCIRCIKN